MSAVEGLKVGISGIKHGISCYLILCFFFLGTFVYHICPFFCYIFVVYTCILNSHFCWCLFGPYVFCVFLVIANIDEMFFSANCKHFPLYPCSVAFIL